MEITVNNVLTKDECRQIIQFSEDVGYHQAQINTLGGKKTNKKRRNNSRFVFKNAQLASQIWNAIERFVPSFSGFQSIGLSSKFKIYRYHPGEKFSWHQDGVVSKGMYELSKLTLLVYLSDGFEGGCTEFSPPCPPCQERNPVDGYKKNRPKIWANYIGACTCALRCTLKGEDRKIIPITGSALIFPHKMLHQGGKLKTGVKYVLRNDVFYKRSGVFGY